LHSVIPEEFPQSTADCVSCAQAGLLQLRSIPKRVDPISMANKPLTAGVRERLLRAARKAMKNAYAPYSHFRVGAAILTSKGKVYLGCNVENASYGMTNCAERTAIFAAIADSGPKLEVIAVAVTNDHGVPCSPCGACRQVIYEFGPEAQVWFQAEEGWKQSHICELLPEGFRLK